MNNLVHYDDKISMIMSIPDEKIHLPGSMPVKIYIQEAEDLYKWCQPDREKLTGNGLDWAMVEDIPARAGALREAQSRWKLSDKSDTETEKEWDEKSPAAHSFRKDLIRAFRFIFSDNASVISRINMLAEGESNSTVIQSLNDLSIFGRDHTEILQAARFDITRLDKAAEMSCEMASILAAVNSRRAFCSDTLKIRNQAYTYLKEAVSGVKKHANYIFWRDPARLRGYTSSYNRKKYNKSKNHKEEPASENIIL